MLSALAAVSLQIDMLAAGWPALRPLALGLCLAAAAFGLWSDAAAAAFVLLFAYTAPAIYLLVVERSLFTPPYLWLAVLFAAILPRVARTNWSIGWPWRPAIVLWAVTIAIGWPLVALRELDFHPSLFGSADRLLNSSSGVLAQNAAGSVVAAGATLLVGLLWFDWLAARFRRDVAVLQTHLVGGLAGSAAVALLVGAYQLFVDVTFVNNGLYGFLRRASGTMLDANAFGVVAGMWGAVFVAFAFVAVRSARLRVGAVTAGLLLSWIGVWGSGSRTGFATGVIAGGWLLYIAWQRRPAAWPRRAIALTAVALALGVLILPAVAKFDVVGPLQRIAESPVPGGVPSAGRVARELWDRDGYGIAAVKLIAEHPLAGVGVGAFSTLVPDYSSLATHGTFLPPDNAQNWYRHQLAELGLLGSVGWIVWTAAFAWFVVTRRAPARAHVAPAALQGAIVAFAAVSFVGMPAQNPAVTITFWTLAFWYTSLRGDSAADAPAPLGVRAAITMTLLVAAFAGTTLYAARHDLRVANRAAAIGWPYSYGFYPPDPLSIRIARRHAVAVVEAPRPWIALTFWINHYDIGSRPVDVSINVDGKPIRTRLTDVAPVTRYVPIAPGHRWIVIETEVSRTLRPSDVGIPDSREIGLFIRWDFVDSPTPGAATLDR